MMPLDFQTALDILAIPLSEPERLFKHKEALKQDYHRFSKRYHPDINKESNAKEVFAHIQALYHKAWDKIDSDLWNPPGVLEISGAGKKFVRIVYRVMRPFKLGTMYIGERLVSFVIDRKHESLVINGLRHIGSIRYPNKDFRQIFEHYFPKIEHYVEHKDFFVICMRKDSSEVLLSDLVNYFGGKLDPEHACWILSSLFNLLSFLEVISITNNGLTKDTVFVSPNRHTVALYGGWWHATKSTNHVLDLEGVRAIGKYAMGHSTLSPLRMNNDIPKSVASFLMSPSVRGPILEYSAWVDALTANGPRKLVQLDISFDDVYPKEKI